MWRPASAGLQKVRLNGGPHREAGHVLLTYVTVTTSSSITSRGGGALPSKIARARARSSAPSHFATTIVATALPIRLVIARASDMKRSTPSSSVSPATGIVGNAASVAASVTNPLPVTAAAPLDVKSSTP